MTGKEKYEIYHKWCIEHHLPVFIQDDNKCPICKHDIFLDGDDGPDPLKYPTGCPVCHRSLCD